MSSIVWSLSYVKAALAVSCGGEAAMFQLEHAFGFKSRILFQIRLNDKSYQLYNADAFY